MSSTKPNLKTLPQEIHDLICESAESIAQLKTLRATCRELHSKTEKVFIKRSFETIHVDSKNIEFLLQVSQSKKYAKVVEKVVVTEGGDAKMLGQALKGLSGLRSVEVLPSSKGWRGWESTGSTAMDQLKSRSSGSCFEMSQGFETVMKALNDASPSVRRVVAGTVPNGDERNSVQAWALERWESAPISSLVRLQELHLVLEPAQFSSLHHFIGACQGLKSLRLEFWGFSDSYTDDVFKNVQLPVLETFHLEAARGVSAEYLRDFIAIHANTLRDLTLKNLFFTEDDLSTLLPQIFNDLHLHTIHLQQLVSGRSGILLLGGDLETYCKACYMDLYATWSFATGPGCDHATMALQGELAIQQELGKRMKVVALPWLPRGPSTHMFMTPEPESRGEQEPEQEQDNTTLTEPTGLNAQVAGPDYMYLDGDNWATASGSTWGLLRTDARPFPSLAPSPPPSLPPFSSFDTSLAPKDFTLSMPSPQTSQDFMSDAEADARVSYSEQPRVLRSASRSGARSSFGSFPVRRRMGIQKPCPRKIIPSTAAASSGYQSMDWEGTQESIEPAYTTYDERKARLLKDVQFGFEEMDEDKDDEVVYVPRQKTRARKAPFEDRQFGNEIESQAQSVDEFPNLPPRKPGGRGIVFGQRRPDPNARREIVDLTGDEHDFEGEFEFCSDDESF